MSKELSLDLSTTEEVKTSSHVMKSEWVFWIFGEPNLAQPYPISKCLVHLDDIVFETAPLSPISISAIDSCITKRDGIGFSYNLYIDIRFKQTHTTFGEKLRFMLVDPHLPMWGNDRASDAEFRAFEQLINSLRAGTFPDIDFNPYNRSYKARGILVSARDIENAYTQPKLVKRPSLFLATLLIFIVIGFMLFLGIWFR